MTEFSDRELLDLYKKDDSRHYAFNMLVMKYREKIYWHIRRMVIDHNDSDDLVQNVFIKVWRNLDGFREESRLYTWIYRIATNECMSFLKKKRTRFFLPLHDVEHELEQKVNADPGLSGDMIQLKLQQAVLTLPERQRVVFNMRYYDEMTYEEISEVLGVTVGALKASFHHAAKKIEEYVTRN
jgi:RNA polymerase sigma factor (sigma-70 family)